ncbi:uncharacterized protein OCT59_026719 [Rhizophagus irregularis]|uniref:uncharacterized protein n=1 Tax=Rhizophagus irregularis TaxID=588596 RepID=UPI001C178F63|nr:hypothetical protein OCT59_026719 [Rhizophagus irregularis]CAB4495997.1 unnamed protein product [Rhizophagus irregularis]
MVDYFGSSTPRSYHLLGTLPPIFTLALFVHCYGDYVSISQFVLTKGGSACWIFKNKKKKLVAFSITESKNRVQFRTNVKSYLLMSDDLFTISGIQMKEDKRPVESKTCGFADYNTSKVSTLQETSASKSTLYRSQSLRLNRKKNTSTRLLEGYVILLFVHNSFSWSC